MKNGKYEENGTTRYYKNGQLHRDNGPAIIWANGNKLYYQNNTLHRIDGPAIIRVDKSTEFWLNGKELKPGTAEYNDFKKICPEYFL